jgi:hypothetical protein
LLSEIQRGVSLKRVLEKEPATASEGKVVMDLKDDLDIHKMLIQSDSLNDDWGDEFQSHSITAPPISSGIEVVNEPVEDAADDEEVKKEPKISDESEQQEEDKNDEGEEYFPLNDEDQVETRDIRSIDTYNTQEDPAYFSSENQYSEVSGYDALKQDIHSSSLNKNVDSYEQLEHLVSKYSSKVKPAESNVKFQAFSPSNMYFEEKFIVSFNAYNVEFEKELVKSMLEKNFKSSGKSRETIRMAFGTDFLVQLYIPGDKGLTCKGNLQRALVWKGDNISEEFNLTCRRSTGILSRQKERLIEGLIFIIYVHEVEISRITFSLRITSKDIGSTETVEAHAFQPTYSETIQCFHHARDRLEFLKWRLALKHTNPDIKICSSGDADIIAVFWSQKAALDLKFSKNVASVVKSKDAKTSNKTRIIVFNLDGTTAIPISLKPYVSETTSFFRKFSISHVTKEVESLVQTKRSVFERTDTKIDLSSQIILGKKIGEGFFGAAFIGKCKDKDVVVKKISLHEPSLENVISILNEIIIMERCSGHPNTGKYYFSRFFSNDFKS